MILISVDGVHLFDRVNILWYFLDGPQPIDKSLGSPNKRPRRQSRTLWPWTLTFWCRRMDGWLSEVDYRKPNSTPPLTCSPPFCNLTTSQPLYTLPHPSTVSYPRLWQMASVSSNVIFVSTSESLSGDSAATLHCVSRLYSPAGCQSEDRLSVLVCLLSHRQRSHTFFCLFIYLLISPSLRQDSFILTHSQKSLCLPHWSLCPRLPVSPLASLHLYGSVSLSPDASCLSFVGRVSVMGPCRNSKHRSGIFFQAIAFLQL